MFKRCLDRVRESIAVAMALTLVLSLIIGCGCSEEYEVLHTGFAAQPASGTAPLEVQFTDESTGVITGWEWDFDNDGQTDDTSSNPSYVYEVPGEYTVSLTVTGPAGTETETKADFITVYETPVSAFSATPISGTVPLEVQFTDESTGVITGWNWDFNSDGLVDSTQQNPLHTYTGAGEYSVSLTVTNPSGSHTTSQNVLAEASVTPLLRPEIEPLQYLKGSTVDFDDATINSASEGGGEAGYKFDLAATIYPSTHYSAAALDAMANTVFPPPYHTLLVSSQVYNTTFDMLTPADQLAVMGAIFAGMPAAEQDVVATAIDTFFNRQDNDVADARDPQETSAYAILQGVSAAAAEGWAADVDAGMDYADRFFVWMLKETVEMVPAMFGLPPGPSEALIEVVALIIGKESFRQDAAGAMYPTQQAEMTEAVYPGVAYADLTAAQQAQVDGAVYANLPSAYASEANRDADRDTYTAYFFSASGCTHYADATATQQAMVDLYIFWTQPPGGASQWMEKDYIDFAAVPEAIMGWGAELADAMDLDQTICYVTLYSSVGYSAAESWKADVETGADPRQAFYRWLSKENVRQSADLGSLIQLSVGEFSFKITNPNDYLISVDSMNIDFRIASDALGEEELVVAARLDVGDKLWVPANGELIVNLVAQTRTLDVITRLVADGKSASDARALAMDVWGQIVAGTAVWEVSVDACWSSEHEMDNGVYGLEWTPA